MRKVRAGVAGDVVAAVVVLTIVAIFGGCGRPGGNQQATGVDPRVEVALEENQVDMEALLSELDGSGDPGELAAALEELTRDPCWSVLTVFPFVMAYELHHDRLADETLRAEWDATLDVLVAAVPEELSDELALLQQGVAEVIDDIGPIDPESLGDPEFGRRLDAAVDPDSPRMQDAMAPVEDYLDECDL